MEMISEIDQSTFQMDNNMEITPDLLQPTVYKYFQNLCSTVDHAGCRNEGLRHRKNSG